MVKIVAMTHFSLLDQRASVYEVSDLARSILFPRTADEKDAAIVVAVKSPTLYAELFDKFQGKPVLSLMPNILTRGLGIQSKAAQKCADIFLKSVTFAQLFRNGILHSDITAHKSARNRINPSAILHLNLRSRHFELIANRTARRFFDLVFDLAMPRHNARSPYCDRSSVARPRDPEHSRASQNAE